MAIMINRALCRQCRPIGLQTQSRPQVLAPRRTPCCKRARIRVSAASGRDGRDQRYQEQAYTPQQSTEPGMETGEEVGQQPGYMGVPPPGYQQQYYQGYPPYPPPYLQESRSQGGGMPAFIWVGVGVLVAVVYSKVSSFFRGGPQAAQARMMSWAMEQAMNQVQKGSGAPGAPPGFPPFSGAGGMPNFGAGFPPPPPANMGGASGQSCGPAFDVTPNAPAAAARSGGVGETAAASASNGSAEARGSRYEELKSREGASRRRGDKAKSRSAFQDVDEEEASTSAAANGGSFQQAEVVGEGAGAGGEGAGAFTVDLMDQFFRDPNMQQLLYKYLPEPMRNPQTFEWMLSNPEYRKQLEGMMQQQGMNLDPQLMAMMKDMDSSDVNAQLESLGLSPSEVINKIMAEPDLAEAFQKPKVMQAIMESQSNPMAIMNYQDDPDVMLVFEKMAKLFPQTAGAPGPPPLQ